MTRQCRGVSAAAATTRADIETMPSLLNDDRLSHGLAGAASATEYFARELPALTRACAAADEAAAQMKTRTWNRRMKLPFVKMRRNSPSIHAGLAGTLDPDEMRRGADDDAVVRDRRGRKRPLIERILADHLELRACGDDERVTVLAEREDLAVVGPRRRREAAHVGRNPLASVDFLAGPGVVCREESSIVKGVVVVAEHQRRGV